MFVFGVITSLPSNWLDLVREVELLRCVSCEPTLVSMRTLVRITYLLCQNIWTVLYNSAYEGRKFFRCLHGLILANRSVLWTPYFMSGAELIVGFGTVFGTWWLFCFCKSLVLDYHKHCIRSRLLELNFIVIFTIKCDYVANNRLG